MISQIKKNTFKDRMLELKYKGKYDLEFYILMEID